MKTILVMRGIVPVLRTYQLRLRFDTIGCKMVQIQPKIFSEELMSQAPMSDITSDDKQWALLAYLPFVGWIIAIVALLMEDKKSRPFVRFHSVQAIVLAVINGVISGLLAAVIIGICTGIAGAAYMVYIGYKAYQGETVKVPFITDFIKQQGWA
jgi:uncharacterized membrane protein